MAFIVALLSLLGLLHYGDLRVHAWEMIIVLTLWSIVATLVPPQNKTSSLLFGSAFVLRLLAIGIAPTLSDDIFRYIWEGNLIWEGGNPYWESAATSSVQHWSKPFVNHPELTSIYPPGAQYLFALLALFADHMWGVQLWSLLCDMGILWLLWRQMGVSKAVWIYALHPLPILENASSGHMESWAILPFLAAIAFPQYRVFLLWMGGIIKILPAVLLPFQRISMNMLVALLVATVCALWHFSLFALPQGAQMYAKHWSFHGSIFPMVDFLLPYPRWIVGAMGILTMLYVWMRVEEFAVQAFWLVGTFVLLSPTVHPWYLLWVFPLALWHRNRAWIVLCMCYPMWYVALTTWDAQSHSWNPPLWPQLISYGCFFGVGLWDWRLSRHPSDKSREGEGL